LNGSDDDAPKKPKRAENKASRSCPYLDTINRHMLDFDFEKVCTVSLSNLHVYACLVCGKYFQGKGIASHAYNHSIHESHHVFISLENRRVYCLPENYEVIDPSLDDIKYMLNPTFTLDEVKQLDSRVMHFRGLDGHDYVPGVIGINNLKKTAYVSVVVNALVRVPPIRDFFLIEKNYAHCKSPLLDRFGELVRKIWSPGNFKGHVSPHELMQAITLLSERKFRIGNPADALDFMTWFLNTLHLNLGGGKKRSSTIYRTFQGTLEVITESLRKSALDHLSTAQMQVTASATETSSFLFLAMDPPVMPVFKDVQEQNIIPQIPLYSVLSKFDGQTVTSAGEEQQKKFRLANLPRYIIVVFRRFKKNNFFFEKNRTIVTFPVKNLEMRDYISPEYLKGMESTKYDLIANICHEGDNREDDNYFVHVLNKASGKWYKVRDMEVEETAAQLMCVTEAYIQIYEQKPAVKKEPSANDE